MSKKIQNAAEQLQNFCLENNLKVATAESCTGGWVSHAIVSLPGSSDWFDCGVVSYSNSAKQNFLHIDEKTLASYGAVSKEVAQDMAQGLLSQCDADMAVAITGIAGPTGGTEDKPVGTVWFAWANRSGGMQTQVHTLTGERNEVREQAVVIALTGFLVE